MSRELKVSLLLTLAFALNYAFLLIPQSNTLRHMYLFDDTMTYSRTYFDYLFKDVSLLIYVYLIFSSFEFLKKALNIALALFYGYIVDYILFYHNPIIGAVSYAWVVMIGYFVLILYTLRSLKWN